MELLSIIPWNELKDPTNLICLLIGLLVVFGLIHVITIIAWIIVENGQDTTMDDVIHNPWHFKIALIRDIISIAIIVLFLIEVFN